MLRSRPYHFACCLVLACCSFILARLLVAQASSHAVESSVPGAKGANESPQLQMRGPLVLEDMVVLDGNDQPVHHLKASDFMVTEDGKPVTVRDFAEATPASATAPSRRLKMGLNTFTNLPRVEPGATLNILLLDSLNTPAEDQSRVRQQMLSYLKDIVPGTRIAIFGLATHLYLLQGFSSDPAVLRSALGQKSSTALSPLLDDPVSGGSDLSITDMMDSSDLLPAAVLANLQQFEAERQTDEARLRMVYALKAMNQLARYLAALPGHKNLIWFSGAFPLNILPDATLTDPRSLSSIPRPGSLNNSLGPNLADPFAAADDFRDDVRQTASLFASSRVAVYPVDARGVMPNLAFSVSQNLPGVSRNGHYAPGSILAANHDFYIQSNAEHSTMDLIAAETGGKAFYNTNGLKQALKQAIDFGQEYYTFAYTPTEPKWDGSYRKIAIITKLPDLHLYFRPGYFADDPNAPVSAREKILQQDAMQTAMLPGGPDATQVIFGARLIPAEKSSDHLSPDAHPDAKRMRPPYMSYTVQFLIDVRTVEMLVDAEGVRHGSAMLVAVVYARDGTPVNSTVRQVRIDLVPDQYAETLKKATFTTLKIDVPVKGEFFVRIGVQDMTGNRVGALEAPVSALHSYDELQAAARKAKK